jgi:hypothetical protein
MKTVLTLVLGLAAGTAFAAEPAFDNHLKSTPMVSPAQIYQTQDVKTDFALGFTSESQETKPETGDKATVDTSGTDLFAAGIYNIKAIGLRAGLVAQFGTSNEETKFVGTTKVDARDLVLSPTAAIPVGPVVVGAAVDFIQRTEKPDGGSEVTYNRNDFRPGVLFAADNLEAGITYVTKSNSDEPKINGVKQPAVRVPAQTTVHGRYAVDKTMAFGAIVTNVRDSAMDKDHLKDQQRLKATGEFDVAAVKVEGDVGYNTKFAKTDADIAQDNIGTVEIGAAADYAINKMAAIGGGLGYEFGSDTNKAKQDVATNTLSVLVRGDMKF